MSFASWLDKKYEERGLMKWLAFLFELIASVALFALMVLTCMDVFGRYFLHSPVIGATELTKIGLAIVIFSSMPVITWRGGQIVVDLIDHVLPSQALKILVVLSYVIVAVYLYFLAFSIFAIGARNLKRRIVTDFLSIPTGYVIQYIAIFSWITAAGVLLVTLLSIFNKEKRKNMEKQ